MALSYRENCWLLNIANFTKNSSQFVRKMIICIYMPCKAASSMSVIHRVVGRNTEIDNENQVKSARLHSEKKAFIERPIISPPFNYLRHGSLQNATLNVAKKVFKSNLFLCGFANVTLNDYWNSSPNMKYVYLQLSFL